MGVNLRKLAAGYVMAAALVAACAAFRSTSADTPSEMRE
jgi:hypothetical protein